jgi:AcrR family transcriptional regulator
MTQEAPKRTRRKSEALRHDILEAARAVFAEKGYAASSTREIAERASAAEPLIFRQFERKANLFAEAVFAPLEDTLKEQIEHTRSVYVQRPPAIDGVRRYVEAILRTTRANKRLFIAYINALAFHANDFSFSAGGRTPPSFQETLIELEESSTIGSGRLTIHDTHFELRLILLFLFSVAMFDELFFTKEEFNHPRIVESLVKLLTMGVGLPPEPQPSTDSDDRDERIRQLEQENAKLRQIVIEKLLQEQALPAAKDLSDR